MLSDAPRMGRIVVTAPVSLRVEKVWEFVMSVAH